DLLAARRIAAERPVGGVLDDAARVDVQTDRRRQELKLRDRLEPTQERIAAAEASGIVLVVAAELPVDRARDEIRIDVRLDLTELNVYRDRILASRLVSLAVAPSSEAVPLPRIDRKL